MKLDQKLREKKKILIFGGMKIKHGSRKKKIYDDYNNFNTKFLSD